MLPEDQKPVVVNGHAQKESGRLDRLKHKLAQTRVIVFVALFAVIGVTYLLFSSADSPLLTSTSANDVIAEFSLPHRMMPVSATNIAPPMTPPFILYGNGLLVCGHDSSMPFMQMPMAADATTVQQPTATTLSQAQIKKLMRQISDTGYFQLHKEYYKTPIVENQDILQVNLLAGSYYVLYYNDVPAPAAYTQTLAILQTYCDKATKPYQAGSVVLRALKDANPKGQSVTANSSIAAPAVATLQQAAVQAATAQAKAQATPASVPTTVTSAGEADQTLTGSTAQDISKQFDRKTRQYIQQGSSTYEVGLDQQLPTINNPLKIDVAAIRQQEAQGGVGAKFKRFISPHAYADSNALVPVRVVLLLPSDGGSTANQGQVQAWGQDVRNWYCGQVGSCYTYQGVQVIRGSKTMAYYDTCHYTPDVCVRVANDPMSAALQNIHDSDAGTVFRNDVDTLVVTGWPTGESTSNGACGVGFAGQNLGILDPYETGCFHDKTMAHELGHTFGLDHTGNSTLMDGPPYAQYSSYCAIDEPTIPLCTLDAAQGASLSRVTTPFSSNRFFPLSSTLYANQRLTPNQYLVSPVSQYKLILQPDGNLVLYNAASQAIWQANTIGRASAYLIMQPDSNLVLYNTSNQAIWQSNTFGKGATHLVVQDNGNLVLLDTANRVVWSTATTNPITPPPTVSSTLTVNQKLTPNLYLRSPSGNFRLILQPDGNLVVYNTANQPTWYDGVANAGVASLIMRSDGNVAEYDKGGVVLWQTSTTGRGGTHLVMQDDGNVVLLNAANLPVWSIATGPIIALPPASSTLTTNQSLTPNQYLLSADRRHYLILQPDGNLVLYNLAGQPTWNSGTFGQAPSRLIMQPDGNLVLYNTANQPIWYSNTYGSSSNRLVMQPDGNLVLYNAANQPTWQSGTFGR